ncbi:hypothetical protein B0H16DRAFT_1881751 [Mycena metata]|uniref:Chromo domain-containing protein n=1 Tax=Mycena metata TaxID=1033252 RepID=A0AAD7JSZ8_9AGAR|nr:hypothetical protein B0H16DRAFT_1881751 [Mycena metata]
MTQFEVFHVDKIIKAKVVKAKTGGKKRWASPAHDIVKAMLICVRQLYLTMWDGYSEDDMTWEPEDSFLTDCALRVFWNSANCRRDHNQISEFKKGEVIELKGAHTTTAKPRSKPGPGRSSVGPIGARVFALCAADGCYYSAYVQERVGEKYVVRFEDDNVEATLPLKHMRECAKLEPGDTITLLRDNALVADLADDGSFTVQLHPPMTALGACPVLFPAEAPLLQLL